ncbi:hypothetical protein BBAD15_g11807 [Beauveria bassiana D1-5]|uniref:Mid2 domain-containing protein n=1 Tax=Beauveria bassiana D1-5 TaxID=1245745 RepID=A0A0A2VA50_BEABA|nr:hypothetical protein BBAD15_g11807 [Beauveria bassiana D1-5]
MSQFRLWAALALLGLITISVMADGVCVGAPSRHVPTIFKIHISKNLGARLPMKQAVYVYHKALSTSSLSAPSGAAPPMSMKSDKGQADKLPAARVSASPSSPASTSASTSQPAASTPPPSSSSTVSPSPTSASPSLTSRPASTPPALSTSTTSTTPSTSAAPVTPATSSTISSGATTTGRSSTSTSAASETSPTSSPVPSSGITSGAAAGIGIGVAIVVVAVAVIAFCLLRNRKKQAAPRHSIEISKPLPGSGPTYPTRDERDRDRDSYDKYGHDIEMTSHRYEDMISSQQPRNMV